MMTFRARKNMPIGSSKTSEGRDTILVSQKPSDGQGTPPTVSQSVTDAGETMMIGKGEDFGWRPKYRTTRCHGAVSLAVTICFASDDHASRLFVSLTHP